MTVFANGLEVSAKAQGCKVIAAFPDTCFTPPENPATPPGVPIPYPNFAMDSDLTSGSSKVLIAGKEISQENVSKFSKVSGDEAGAAAKKGLITSKNTGKAYAQKWSMDVKVEGKGVVRFSDMATTNHMSNTGNDAPWIIAGLPGAPSTAGGAECLVGSFETIQKKCNARGGEAHHIIPDEYLRTTNRTDAQAAANAKSGTPSVPDTTRKDDDYPSTNEGCAICVGGSGSGRKSKDSNKAAVKKKGKEYQEEREKSGSSFLGYNNSQGHGFAHFIFDSLFGAGSKPIGHAVNLAYFALAELAEFDGSTVDKECAQAGAGCIAEQYEEILKRDPQPECSRSNRQSPSLDNRMEAWGVTLKKKLTSWATFSANAGFA